MPKDTPTIKIPLALARLISSEPDDFKDPNKYAEVQAVNRAMIRLLIVSQD